MKQIHYCLATAYENLGDPKRAVKHLQRIYTSDPQFMNVGDELKRLTTSMND